MRIKCKSLAEYADQLRLIQKRQLPLTMKSMLQQFGSECKEDVQERLIGRLTPLGAIARFPAWPALKASTINQKIRRGWGKGGNPYSILYATGKLQQSVRMSVDITRKRVTVGTDDEIAKYHEYGFVHWISGQRVGPRPVFGPAALRTMAKLYPRWERYMQRTLAGKRVF